MSVKRVAKSASKKDADHVYKAQTCGLEIHFRNHYPKHNPEGTVEDVTKALLHTGCLDDIKDKKRSEAK